MSIAQIEAIIKDFSNAKQGWKTSEFWVALAPIVVAIIHVLGGSVGSNATNVAIIAIFGACSAVYVAARTWLKRARLNHAISLSYILVNLEKEAKQEVTHILHGDGTVEGHQQVLATTA